VGKKAEKKSIGTFREGNNGDNHRGKNNRQDVLREKGGKGVDSFPPVSGKEKVPFQRKKDRSYSPSRKNAFFLRRDHYEKEDTSISEN